MHVNFYIFKITESKGIFITVDKRVVLCDIPADLHDVLMLVNIRGYFGDLICLGFCIIIPFIENQAIFWIFKLTWLNDKYIFYYIEKRSNYNFCTRMI